MLFHKQEDIDRLDAYYLSLAGSLKYNLKYMERPCPRLQIQMTAYAEKYFLISRLSNKMVKFLLVQQFDKAFL
jgi:hypothetical protein